MYLHRQDLSVINGLVYCLFCLHCTTTSILLRYTSTRGTSKWLNYVNMSFNRVIHTWYTLRKEWRI